MTAMSGVIAARFPETVASAAANQRSWRSPREPYCGPKPLIAMRPSVQDVYCKYTGQLAPPAHQPPCLESIILNWLRYPSTA